MVAMAAGPSFQDIVYALLRNLLHLNIIDPGCCQEIKIQINADARMIKAQQPQCVRDGQYLDWWGGAFVPTRWTAAFSWDVYLVGKVARKTD